MSEKTYRTRTEVLDDPDLNAWQRGQIIAQQNLGDPEPTVPQLNDEGRFYLLGLKSRVKSAQVELVELVHKEQTATDAIPLLSDEVAKLQKTILPDAPEAEVLKLLVAQTRLLLAQNAANLASARRQQLRAEWLPLLTNYHNFLNRQFGGAGASSRLFLNGHLPDQLRGVAAHIQHVLDTGTE